MFETLPCIVVVIFMVDFMQLITLSVLLSVCVLYLVYIVSVDLGRMIARVSIMGVALTAIVFVSVATLQICILVQSAKRCYIYHITGATNEFLFLYKLKTSVQLFLAS